MSPRMRMTLAVAGACALALVAVTVPSSLAAVSARVRVGMATRLPSGTGVLGQLPGSTEMHVAVALRPSNPAALAAFVHAVSTPGSSRYRHYITPAQFAARFGPTDAQIAALDASLRAHGLSPGRVSVNHLAIPVSATANQLQRAFSLTLSRVKLANNATGIVNRTAPLFDANIAGLVQGIAGLNTLAVPHPLDLRPDLLRPDGVRAHSARHVVTGGPQPCSTARSQAPGQGAYTIDQIAAAYGFSGLYKAGDEGAGETVAVYELEPYAASDIAAYQSCYGTHASVSNIPVDGGAGSGPGSGEAALDVEQMIGLVPKANILVYEGPNSNSSGPASGYFDTWNAIISQDRARVISTSWGQCEALVGATNAALESTLFQEAAAQGQTIVAAAGDDGSEDCFSPVTQNTALAVDDPSSQPYVTGVGGTTLKSPGPRPIEQVWNDGGNPFADLTAPGAGGGGISAIWPMPSYQLDAPASLNVRQSASRESPDVSADADPNTGYLVDYDGGWIGIGGTSGAAPLWAAVFALADDSSGCYGGRIGFANPALYAAAASAYGEDFNDVTVGNNDFLGSNGGKYAAGPGYDFASGLGTPNATPLVAALCAHATLIGSPSVSDASLTGVRDGKPTLQFTVAAGANVPALKSIAITLPNGLRFVRGYRRIEVKGPRGFSTRFNSGVSGRVLTINLASAKTRVRVRISYATITATEREAAAVRRRQARKLTVALMVTNAQGHKTHLATAVKPRS